MSRDCRIIDHPEGLDALKAHPTDKYELVLQARHPPKAQSHRGPDFEVKDCSNRTDADNAL
jgi:hypothetical protein